MNSKPEKSSMKIGLAIKLLRVVAFLLVLSAVGQDVYAQGRVEEEVRKKSEEKNDIARRQEAAERARMESAKTTEKLNETKSLNKMESLNKERALNKPEVRDQAKLKEASEALKNSGTTDSAVGSKKATEVGNPTTSGEGGRARGRVPTKLK